MLNNLVKEICGKVLDKFFLLSNDLPVVGLRYANVRADITPHYLVELIFDSGQHHGLHVYDCTFWHFSGGWKIERATTVEYADLDEDEWTEVSIAEVYK